MKLYQRRFSLIKRIIMIFVCILLIALQFACENDPYYGHRPSDQENSVWYCKDFDIRFIVDDEGSADGTIRNSTERIPFTIIWSAVSNDAFFVQNYRRTTMGQKYDILLDGKCDFSENEFVFNVLKDDTKVFDSETPIKLKFSKIDPNGSFYNFLGNSYIANAEKSLESVKDKFLAFRPEMIDIALAISKNNPNCSLYLSHGILTSSDGKLESLPQNIGKQLEICKPLLMEFDSVYFAYGNSLEDGELMFSKTLIETSKIMNRNIFVILSYSPILHDNGEEIWDDWYIKIYSAA